MTKSRIEEVKQLLVDYNTTFDFEKVALEVFHHQLSYCEVYEQFVSYLGIAPSKVQTLDKIPFLPIEFFKKHKILTSSSGVEMIFESSGTTDFNARSKHYVTDLAFYASHSIGIFQENYGDITDYTFLALLPSYLERSSSSLVFMVDSFMSFNKQLKSFYMSDFASLRVHLADLIRKNKKVVLIGVTFALLDFVEEYPMDLSSVIIMETGGMKGRKEEMQRSEVHKHLSTFSKSKNIHSEYGMTELMSQFYSKSKGVFIQGRTVKCFLRELNDPISISSSLKRGGVNIIDLGNIDSCSFIATQDIARFVNKSDDFEILGRLDYSDLRGCSLLYV